MKRRTNWLTFALIIFFAAVALSFMSGCSLLLGSDRVQDLIKKGGGVVDDYCSKFGAQDRAAFREAFNPTDEGATLVITCPGD